MQFKFVAHVETYQYTVGGFPFDRHCFRCVPLYVFNFMLLSVIKYIWIPSFFDFLFSVALHHDPPKCVTSAVGDDAYRISSRDSGPCISTMTCCSGDRMVFFWLFRKAGFIHVNILCYFHNRQCGYTWSCSNFTMRYHLCCNWLQLVSQCATTSAATSWFWHNSWRGLIRR